LDTEEETDDPEFTPVIPTPTLQEAENSLQQYGGLDEGCKRLPFQFDWQLSKIVSSPFPPDLSFSDTPYHMGGIGCCHNQI
jgi:hypothetical protein